MKHCEAITVTLFDLIKINEDHIHWYQNLIDNSFNLKPGLVEIFNSKVKDSSNNIEALKALLDSVQTVTFKYHGTGNIYHTWTQANAGKHAENTLLENCEGVEDAALEAYKTALSAEFLTNTTCLKVLMDQKFSLQWFKTSIKKYSDLETLALSL